jgi:regulator of sigma E protease
MVDVDENELWEAPFLKRLLIFLGGPLANIISLFVAAILVDGIGGGLAYGWRIISITAVSPFLVLFGYVPTDQIMGPVGIVSFSTIFLSQGLGLAGVLRLFAVISGAIGIFNLFPFPVLDGGRVVISVLHEFGLSKKAATVMIIVSFLLLITLMVFVTFKDVARLF